MKPTPNDKKCAHMADFAVRRSLQLTRLARCRGSGWCHSTCGFYMPGLRFTGAMAGIEGVDRIDPKRMSLRCALCE